MTFSSNYNTNKKIANLSSFLTFDNETKETKDKP